MLSRHQPRDQAEEAFEIVARCQFAKTSGADLEERRQVGQAHALTLGGRTEDIFAKASGRIVGAGTQGFPTLTNTWRPVEYFGSEPTATMAGMSARYVAAPGVETSTWKQAATPLRPGYRICKSSTCTISA